MTHLEHGIKPLVNLHSLVFLWHGAELWVTPHVSEPLIIHLCFCAVQNR